VTLDVFCTKTKVTTIAFFASQQNFRICLRLDPMQTSALDITGRCDTIAFAARLFINGNTSLSLISMKNCLRWSSRLALSPMFHERLSLSCRSVTDSARISKNTTLTQFTQHE
jgi:hypothetical protein